MPVVRVNFRMTENALAELRVWNREAAATEPGRNFVPVIGWHEEYEEAQRKLVEHGIYLGWYYVEQVPADEIQEISGMKIVFAATPKQAAKFDGRTIDFVDGRLRFLE